jgi:hypothetical protein
MSKGYLHPVIAKFLNRGGDVFIFERIPAGHFRQSYLSQGARLSETYAGAGRSRAANVIGLVPARKPGTHLRFAVRTPGKQSNQKMSFTASWSCRPIAAVVSCPAVEL